MKQLQLQVGAVEEEEEAEEETEERNGKKLKGKIPTGAPSVSEKEAFVMYAGSAAYSFFECWLARIIHHHKKIIRPGGTLLSVGTFGATF